MLKRLIALFLTLLLIVQTCPALMERAVPTLTDAEITALKQLAGGVDDSAQWHEGMAPSASMSAWQMYKWADWFLSNTLRSLMLSAQSYTEHWEDKTSLTKEQQTIVDIEWKLHDLEDELSYHEEILENGRLAILNGIDTYQSEDATDSDKISAYDRMMEAKAEIEESIETIADGYAAYKSKLDTYLNRFTAVQSNAAFAAEEDAYTEQKLEEAEAIETKENATNAGFDVTVIEKNQIAIIVKDENENPLQGVQVELTKKGKKTTLTATTDAKGRTIFKISDFKADENKRLTLSVKLSKSGYRTYEVKYLAITGGSGATYTLEKDDGTPYLIMAGFNEYDILSEEHTYYYSKKNDYDHTFTVKINSNQAGTLTLCYGEEEIDDDTNKDEPKKKIVKKTVSQSFDANNTEKEYKFTGKWLQTIEPDSDVFLTVTLNDKTEKNFPCLLYIEEPLIAEPLLDHSALFSFTPGSSGLGFKIPDGVPFFGGSTLNLLSLTGNKPTLLVLHSGIAMFSWGRDFAYEREDWKTDDKIRQDRKMEDYEAYSLKEKALAAVGAYENINTSRQVKTLAGASAHVTPFVALQGIFKKSEKVIQFRGNAGINMAFKAGLTQTFLMGPVPFFAGVDFSMGMNFGTGVTVTMKYYYNDGKLKFDTDSLEADFDGLTVSIRLEIGGTFGIGLKDVACVSFRGYGYINPIIHFANPVRAEAKIGMGFSATVKVLFLKWHKTLWEGTMPLNGGSNGTDDGEYIQLDDTGISPAVVAAGGAENGGDSILSPVTVESLFSSIHSSASNIQFANLDGTTYAFWIGRYTYESYLDRVIWYNLDDLSKHGEITWPDNYGAQRAVNPDYDFVVDTARQTDKTAFCALTILSGRFDKRQQSSTTAAEPTECRMAAVLMQKQSDGSLSMLYYSEDDGRLIGETLSSGGYMTMPEVFLSVAGSDLTSVYILSTCVKSNDQSKYRAVAVQYDRDEKKLVSTSLDTKRMEDNASIASYAIGRPYAVVSTAPEEEKVSLYSVNENRSLSRIRVGSRCEEMVAGNVVNYHLVSKIEGDNSDKDFIFYLESSDNGEGQIINRLKSALVNPQEKHLTGTYTDYDVEVVADTFDVVRFGEAVYIYWVECATPPEDDSGDYKESYLVKCTRYDMDTNTMSAPFSLVELSQKPDTVKMYPDGTGYYTFNLDDDDANSVGSYTTYSLKKFTYRLVMAAEVNAAVPSDTCVCAGEYTDVVFSVTNTGNLPISSFNIAVRNEGSLVQTIHVDCTAPDNNTNEFYTAYGTNTQTGQYTVRRISSIYDDVNGDSWDVTETDANGVTTEKSVRTKLLMPGDTHAYTSSLLIPADWSGDKSLTAEVEQVVATTKYSGLLSVNGAEAANAIVETVTGTRGENADEASSEANDVLCRLLGNEAMDTNVHDLVLTAQPYQVNGKRYVSVNITNRSGNSVSDAIPTFTVTNGDEVLYSYTFVESLGDGYGYTFDVPVETLTGGKKVEEIELNVLSSSNGYEEYAEANNHVTITLDKPLTISEQPVGLTLYENDTAVFSVTAAGGTTPYAYRWQQYYPTTSQWLDIPGTTGRTYTVTKVRQSQTGLTVRCVVTDAAGDSVTSYHATLEVLALPTTGDASTPTLWLLMILVPIVVMGVYLVMRKRKE